MVSVALHIQDLVTRMTAKAMLEAAGHPISTGDAAVIIVDNPRDAVQFVPSGRVLLLTTAAEAAAAVVAMQQGVFGYVLLPFVPGELVLMVQRAAQPAGGTSPAEPAAEPLTLEARELQHIQETLRRCRHNQAEAARQLGIGRNTLWRKLKRLRAAAEEPSLSGPR